MAPKRVPDNPYEELLKGLKRKPNPNRIGAAKAPGPRQVKAASKIGDPDDSDSRSGTLYFDAHETPEEIHRAVERERKAEERKREVDEIQKRFLEPYRKIKERREQEKKERKEQEEQAKKLAEQAIIRPTSIDWCLSLVASYEESKGRYQDHRLPTEETFHPASPDLDLDTDLLLDFVVWILTDANIYRKPQ